MTSDYTDNWDALPAEIQQRLAPIIEHFEVAADLLFDRRLNLSFEAAVKELSIPGIVALTEGLRELSRLLRDPSWEIEAETNGAIFEGKYSLSVYDLPLYMPCVYLSQLAQYMDGQNVRVWKEATAEEIVEILLVVARFVPLQTETARIVTAALHDMLYLYPATQEQAANASLTCSDSPSAMTIAEIALALAQKSVVH